MTTQNLQQQKNVSLQNMQIKELKNITNHSTSLVPRLGSAKAARHLLKSL